MPVYSWLGSAPSAMAVQSPSSSDKAGSYHKLAGERNVSVNEKDSETSKT